ncbi:phosphoribosylglycinamide formyltransferase [Aquirhabdus parva]|uniref:Phosphoribosylglycinamide formyltransferase n=1 Tax=Aquirhabdus parva TaxID=2283318 RepID=A0A345P6D7_9GAMM|nr:phosphoribosylglycinamide formyltransferase [Aquirhabdus parva]AXI02846.1 phosphoribosylglycinamide formyltransferase [Aquirhabdus parva]
MTNRIVVLVSGNGSNLQALIDSCQTGRIRAEIVGVISNVPHAYALERARLANIPTQVIDHRKYPDRAAFEAEMSRVLQEWQVGLIVLAGFMRVLTPAFVNRFSGQMINIHPSLLPAYRGLHTHARVLATGDKMHGCSIHFVTAELDAGAIIAQAITHVMPNDTLETLTQEVQELEHHLYPLVVAWIAAGRIALLGNKVYLDGQELQDPIRICL